MKNEAINKHEYSVLQSAEYQYRNVENSNPYFVLHRALETDLTVIGFPLKGETKGYAVMLANATGKPEVKIVPDAEFVVTPKALAAVKAETDISSALDSALASRMTR
ncbi:hypothetical protein [Burkholderia cenocepacia]|uniref:hypothetical protein n=1 Tax=Burkholderia cenocepacia TaxID=95486 RepID=UPI0022384698|nr:hypothetical protein [Burkholderia cenocepacia]MCW5140676.1 hypothetical protein [Burkholderia cenocepacia]